MMSLAPLARFCGSSHWLAMPTRLNFLTDSPARLECFAEALQHLAGRPEEGRVFRRPERCPIELGLLPDHSAGVVRGLPFSESITASSFAGRVVLALPETA